MKSSFLGKPIPSSEHARSSLARPAAFSWLLYIIAPLILSSSYLYILTLTNPLFPSSPSPVSLVSSPVVRVLADNATAASTSQGTLQNRGGNGVIECRMADVVNSSEGNPKNIFPLIPPQLLPENLSGGKTLCPPEAYNLDVVRYFAYKAASFATWLATALAIILTIYAGLLYLSGFANEKNTQTAKSILLAVYSGLLIVVLAKVILYGSVSLISGSAVNPGQATDPYIIKPSSSPSPAAAP